MNITFDKIKYAVYNILVESKLNNSPINLLPLYNKAVKRGILKEAHELSVEIKNSENLKDNVYLLSIASKCNSLKKFSLQELNESTQSLYNDIILSLDTDNKKIFTNFIKKSSNDTIDKLITYSINEKNNLLYKTINESYIPITEDINAQGNSFDLKVIKLAINKFNDKYDCLNETEKKIIKGLALNDDINLNTIFEDTKINLVKSIKRKLLSNDDVLLCEKLNKTIDKIKLMEYNSKSFLDDFSKLENLKKGLV